MAQLHAHTQPDGDRPVTTGVTDAQRIELLTAVGDVVDGTSFLGETVQRLLSIIVPDFADVATLDAVGPTGEMRRLAARVERPRSPELEAALLARHQPGGGGVGVLRTVATGESQLVAPVTDDFLRAITTAGRDYELMRSLELRATIYAPLRARGRVLGALACSTRSGGRTFTPDDLRVAEALASRIGLALDNAGLSETVSGLERRLEVTLANLSTGVLVRDADGAMVFANATAAELLGMESVEQLFGATSEDTMNLFEAYDESGRRLSLEDLPSARALLGERPEPLVARSIRRSTGAVRWLLHHATPVFEPDGRLSIIVNVFEDVTRAKRAELSQRFLSRASSELSSSLDYEQTLQRVARMAVPELADWCGVSLVGSGEFLEQVAVAHVDPDKVALAREWGQRSPARLEARTGAAAVVRSGRSQLVPEVTEEMLATSGASERQVALVRELGMRSVLIVPLALPGSAPFGTLSLVMAESGRHFDDHDLVLAEELGRRAALAVQNSHLYTERSRIAAVLEQSLRQPDLPEIPGFALASLYHPAGDASEVGGDFYDAFPTPDGWMVVIGDVMGHGAEAAALTALSRHTLRTAARLLSDPVQVLEQLELALHERHQTALVTVCCAVLRVHGGEASAQIVLGGHPQPYRLRGNEVSAVGRPAQILGLGGPGNWRTETIGLGAGDQLVLFTDGVIDTMGDGERFEHERLRAALRGAAGASGSIARVDGALAAFRRGAPRDDVAVLAVERLAAG